ncbi:hypothetical protein ACLKA6_000119 [Drosophila palustris]
MLGAVSRELAASDFALIQVKQLTRCEPTRISANPLMWNTLNTRTCYHKVWQEQKKQETEKKADWLQPVGVLVGFNTPLVFRNCAKNKLRCGRVKATPTPTPTPRHGDMETPRHGDMETVNRSQRINAHIFAHTYKDAI